METVLVLDVFRGTSILECTINVPHVIRTNITVDLYRNIYPTFSTGRVLRLSIEIFIKFCVFLDLIYQWLE